jgi:Dyp-type peroxidase family
VAPAPVTAAALDLDDVQGLALYAYGRLRAARYVLLRAGDGAEARRWLGELAGRVTSAAERAEATAVNVALTAPGLAALGLPAEALAGFSLEFTEGIVSPHRSRILGDVGESSPERWTWGGPGGERVDVLLLLFASDEPALADLQRTNVREAGAAGLRVVAMLDTVDLGDVEHFGFRDGISQPAIAGAGRPASALNTIQPGEFLLGYVNEHGQITERPTLDPAADRGAVLPRDPATGRPDLGRNGAYLVARQLRQDVRGFWRWADAETRAADGTADPAALALLASKMVGRWPSGAPLLLAPERDDPALSGANDFAYHEVDPNGWRCPVGAHVRRANPRDSLEPRPGTERSIAVGKRHRLVRRGREYGPPVAPGTLLDEADDGVDRGLHFICLCGNIARQFEFVQSTWVMSPKFAGLHADDDPLLGSRAGGGEFRVQGRPLRRRLLGLPRFVTVRGGGYFFLPGLRALRYVAAPSST